MARQWDLQTLKSSGPPLMHSEQVSSVQFSADGRWILTATQDRFARLWAAELCNPITPYLPVSSREARVVFTGDNGDFAIVENPRQFTMWKIPSDKRPPADISLHSRFLSSSLPPDEERPGSIGIQKMWNHLKQHYPDAFRASARAKAGEGLGGMTNHTIPMAKE
jgi:WD40 repeat protein